MNIPEEYSSKTIDIIAPRNYRGAGVGSRSRTPLHIEFSHDSDRDIYPIERAEQIAIAQTDDPEIFNAIGSRHENGARVHHPVIDVNGGAEVQRVKGSKAIIHTWHTPDSRYPWQDYAPDSLLRDVLGDNGIDLEVFHAPHTKAGITISRWAVESLVLRSKESKVFGAVASTQEAHSHLYIQQSFEEADHQTLITELGKLGIISPHWERIVNEEGMGIVRTPWVKKESAPEIS